MVRLVIVGAGGHGAELASYLETLARPGQLELAGVLDDARGAGPFGASAILGGVSDLPQLLTGPAAPTHYITAVGDNRIREALVARIEALASGRLVAWNLHHPGAIVGTSARLGSGVCLAPGSILTTRLSIGDHTIVNVKASVSHDCEIGEFVNLNPGVTICGNVRIGRGAYVGAGATVIDKVSVGAWTVVGAGAVVIDDVPAGVTVVGVPARIVKQHTVRHP